MPKTSEGKPETYLNPVYPYSFPDPFVLKFRGEYFAYCTGNAADGNLFGILRSRDLVNWTYVGSAMEPLTSRPPYYWAPEVTYDDGKFYLYYSAGNEILMEIRVAVSDRPDGGFVDNGVRLTYEEFAIDAHVFIDCDGSRYMFYATDFLEYSHIGTGTVVDRMIDWKTLEGKPRPVTRAKYDWQVYDPARKEKGGVRWYTVEGPTVLERKGKYFEMFSGGNWQNKTYGVSFAVADSMNFSNEWTQFSDGEKILPILRTIPGEVVGPGHNSAVRGPNNRELYCIYHRWTEAGRVLAIDRMDFAGDRIFVAGPTTTEQPMPYRPVTLECLSQEKLLGWSLVDNELISPTDDRAELTIDVPGESFLLECSVRFREKTGNGSFVIEIGQIRIEVPGGERKAILRSVNGEARQIGLPADFDHAAWHLLRVEKNWDRCRVMIDNVGQRAEVQSAIDASAILMVSDGAEAAISAIELTPGFEESFETDDIPGRFHLIGRGAASDGQLSLRSEKGNDEVRAAFSVSFAEFEMSVNISNGNGYTGGYGLILLDKTGTAKAHLTARPEQMTISFEASTQAVSIDLPDAFVGNEFRQFRLVRQAGRLSAHLDGIFLSSLPFEAEVSLAVIYGTNEIFVEMVRLTAI